MLAHNRFTVCPASHWHLRQPLRRQRCWLVSLWDLCPCRCGTHTTSGSVDVRELHQAASTGSIHNKRNGCNYPECAFDKFELCSLGTCLGLSLTASDFDFGLLLVGVTTPTSIGTIPVANHLSQSADSVRHQAAPQFRAPRYI